MLTDLLQETDRAQPLRVRYWPALDGLRAFAVLGVMGAHSGLAPGGIFGVDVFFVLSGFLITSLLLEQFRRTTRIDLLRFYRRRVLRLLPASLAVLALAVIAGEIFLNDGDRHTLWPSALSVLTYTADFHVTAQAMPLLAPYWSLSLEEQFYFVWPIILLGILLLTTISLRALARILLGSGLAAGLCGIFLVLAGGSPSVVGSYPQFRGCGLLLGCALAAAFAAGWQPFGPRAQRLLLVAATAAAVVLCVAAVAFPRDDPRTAALGGYLAAGICSTIVIAALVAGADDYWLTRLLSMRPIVVLGTWSYALYLVHSPVFTLINLIGLTDAERIPLGFAVAITIAWAVHVLIEQPGLRLKDRLEAKSRLRADLPASA